MGKRYDLILRGAREARSAFVRFACGNIETRKGFFLRLEKESGLNRSICVTLSTSARS